MLALTTPIKQRLQAIPALTGWAVRSGTDAVDRRPLPAVDVRCSDARVSERKTSAVMLAPQWTVTLATRRGPDAADMLDAALAAVIESLHGWAPGLHGGRGWERLEVIGAAEPAFGEEGIASYQITFATAALYRGQA